MQKDSKSIYQPHERLEIYSKAYKLYYNNHVNTATSGLRKSVGGRRCLGMCQAMNAAIVENSRCRLARKSYVILSRENFPEYFSYKPKTGWKKDTRFWWTPLIKNGGADKRMYVLNRLAMGLSKGE
jgi:hypothetical protein